MFCLDINRYIYIFIDIYISHCITIHIIAIFIHKKGVVIFNVEFIRNFDQLEIYQLAILKCKKQGTLG